MCVCVCVYLLADPLCIGMCRSSSLWWAFFCLAHSILQNFPRIIISSQYFCPAPLSQESGVWMKPTALGPGKKIAFPWAGSWALTSVTMFSLELTLSRTEMGEIMIVWCSGGGENEERFWVIQYSVAWQPVKSYPAKDRKAEPLWSMLLPPQDWVLHHGNTETLSLDMFSKKLCCIDCMVHVFRQTYSPYQHHQESYVCPSVCWIFLNPDVLLSNTLLAYPNLEGIWKSHHLFDLLILSKNIVDRIFYCSF